MNLDKLRPAWRQYKLENSLDQLREESILAMIEDVEPQLVYFPGSVSMMSGLLLSLMMLCCQGG